MSIDWDSITEELDRDEVDDALWQTKCEWHVARALPFDTSYKLPIKLVEEKKLEVQKQLANRIREWPYCQHGGTVKLVWDMMPNGSGFLFKFECTKCSK